MVDYKVGDWVERIEGGDYPSSGMYMGNTYRVALLSEEDVKLEGIEKMYRPDFFRLSKNTIVRNILNDL